ncbi:MAG: hypothetical protein J7M09_07590, partial [Deltaproteobacteria bacterium]|nr:hypothetical protein [Candidatus Tharpella sp.]
LEAFTRVVVKNPSQQFDGFRSGTIIGAEQKVKRGSITKTGNGHVRRVLVEAAQSYRLPTRISRAIRKRQEGVPDKVSDIAWKAQVRLCKRYHQLVVRGKNANLIKTAIAREIVGFSWATAQEI